MAKSLWLWCPLATLLFLSAAVAAGSSTQKSITDNPADKLVAVINENRTGHGVPSLYDNPGLACIALQYIKAYEGDCNDVGPNGKKPSESLFVQTFAPNCGVQVASLAQITGRLLGCQSEYVHAQEAFSEVLTKNGKSLDILYNKNHTEVGAAVSGSDGGSPYFWCVLFSNGKSNSSFTFSGGVAKTSRPGCFSGANDICSGSYQSSKPQFLWTLATTALISFVHAFR